MAFHSTKAALQSESRALQYTRKFVTSLTEKHQDVFAASEAHTERETSSKAETSANSNPKRAGELIDLFLCFQLPKHSNQPAMENAKLCYLIFIFTLIPFERLLLYEVVDCCCC